MEWCFSSTRLEVLQRVQVKQTVLFNCPFLVEVKLGLFQVAVHFTTMWLNIKGWNIQGNLIKNASSQWKLHVKMLSKWFPSADVHVSIYLFICLYLRLGFQLFDMKDLWFPGFSRSDCIPDGCVYMHAAVYEFGIMMDDGTKRRGHEPVYTGTRYISIHLLLMQQPQLWGSGTRCWRPIESWVIYHVQFQRCTYAMHDSISVFIRLLLSFDISFLFFHLPAHTMHAHFYLSLFHHPSYFLPILSSSLPSFTTLSHCVS